MKKKHVIFDFDGTLVNTNDVIIASWRATFRHFTGSEPKLETITSTFGEPLYDSMERFFPGRCDEGVKVYRDYQFSHADTMVRPFDGIRELVTGLRENGHTTSIVTARTTDATHNYLRSFGMDRMFDVIVAYEDTDAHKPEPTPLLVGLEKLGSFTGEAIDKADAILLGDTKYDMGCGSNAGVDTVLVGWSIRQDRDEMRTLGWAPTYEISRPEELFAIVG